MTKDDIIRMAEAAGMRPLPLNFGFPALSPGNVELVRFAKLIAAAEREECAKVCEDADIREFAMGDQPYPEWYADLIRARGQG